MVDPERVFLPHNSVCNVLEFLYCFGVYLECINPILRNFTTLASQLRNFINGKETFY